MEDLGFEEPLGALYLSAVCKENGHSVYAAENNLSSIERKIKTIKPDLIAISVVSPSFSYLFQTVKQIKTKYNIPAVFGGPHITFFPEVASSNSVDYALMGEGEAAFVEFLNLLQKNEPINKIKNLIFKDKNNQLIQNPLRPLVSNLDRIPFPDRELFSGYKQFYEADVRSVVASRGCPYKCSYCFNNEYNKLYDGLGNKVRLRSVDNVIGECVELKNKYKAKMIHFFDDIFPWDNIWLDEFVKKYKEKINLPFLTNTSFTVCSENYIRNLKYAGCKTLLIGVETADEDLREKVLFRKISNKSIIEKSRLIHKYGIKIYSQNLVGLPYGSLQKDIETLKLNIDLKADLAGAYICHPYPKTAIEKMAKDSGLLNYDRNIGRSFYYSSPLNIPEKWKVEKLRTIFSIAVCFPFLFRHINAILKLPGLPLQFIAYFFHGYKIKTVVLKYKMGIRPFFKNIILFFTRRINRPGNPDD